MNTTDDPEVFRERWNAHIDELKRLKSTLDPDSADWEALDDNISELKAIVERASLRFEENDDSREDNE